MMIKGLSNYIYRIRYLNKCLRFYVEYIVKYKLNLKVKYKIKEINLNSIKKINKYKN